jgi:hypothetical protein
VGGGLERALAARDAAALGKIDWRRIVVDEAQAIKNAATGQATAIRTLFILRRLKTDRSIIADLPEKFEMDVLCDLTSEQGREQLERCLLTGEHPSDDPQLDAVPRRARIACDTSSLCPPGGGHWSDARCCHSPASPMRRADASGALEPRPTATPSR